MSLESENEMFQDAMMGFLKDLNAEWFVDGKFVPSDTDYTQSDEGYEEPDALLFDLSIPLKYIYTFVDVNHVKLKPGYGITIESYPDYWFVCCQVEDDKAQVTMDSDQLSDKFLSGFGFVEHLIETLFDQNEYAREIKIYFSITY
jgi:hypothetical protein